MRWSVWDPIEDYLIAANIQPLLAVIPDNHDESLKFELPNPRFWDRVRSWQARGWAIGLHGYRHQYVTQNPGLLGINCLSEFAGLPEEEQARKIDRALSVFRNEGVRPDAWVAPAHSFDASTVRALRAANLRTISDGFSVYPVTDRNGMFWVPQQIWRFRRMPFGVWTICAHHNMWNKTAGDVFRANAERYSAALTSLDELKACYGNRKAHIIDGMSAPLISRIVRARASAETRRERMRAGVTSS